MPTGLSDRDWRFLIQTIGAGKSIPFLGHGACYPVLPLGSKISRIWAEEYDYPLGNGDDLVQVAQYLAVNYDPLFPKLELLRRWYDNAVAPDFEDPIEPHGVMADLPLPIYITTNYDDFMVQALRKRNKNPRREICRWNEHLSGLPSIFELEPNYIPTPEEPVVFHLHGNNEIPESLVLAEDDYLDFIENVSKEPELVPNPIREALARTSLLFIGYGFREWTFRIIFRSIAKTTHRTLQLPPEGQLSEENKLQSAQNFLERYFDRMAVRVYWGSTMDFMGELRLRWEETVRAPAKSPPHSEKTGVTSRPEESAMSEVRIFLSYAREDESMVEDLYKRLSEAGFRPWMDKLDLIPGEQWRPGIKRAIENSDFFFACLSNTSVKKRGYLQREFKEALNIWQEKLESDIYLIPVRIDDCDVPENLREFQWVNLFERNGFERLVRAIRIGIERQSD
jgi:hypothetical protein